MKELLGDVFDDAPLEDAAPASPVPGSAPARADPTGEEDGDLALAEGLADEDTLVLSRRLLRKVELRIAKADPVRFASLIEKASGLINRIEQIEARRPRVPPRDEVQDAIRGAMGEATEFLLRQTREAAAKLEADRRAFAAWCRGTLAPAHAAEVVERVSAIVDGRTCARCSKPRKGELPVCAEHEQAETVGGATT